MKKYSIFAPLLCASLSTLAHSDDGKSHDARKPASAETQQFARSIFEKLGVNQHVAEILHYNEEDRKTHGCSPLYVLTESAFKRFFTGTTRHVIFINPDSFDLLTVEEKIYLLAHEAGHIVLHHYKNIYNPQSLEDMAKSREDESAADRFALEQLPPQARTGALRFFSRFNQEISTAPYNSHLAPRDRLAFIASIA